MRGPTEKRRCTGVSWGKERIRRRRRPPRARLIFARSTLDVQDETSEWICAALWCLLLNLPVASGRPQGIMMPLIRCGHRRTLARVSGAIYSYRKSWSAALSESDELRRWSLDSPSRLLTFYTPFVTPCIAWTDTTSRSTYLTRPQAYMLAFFRQWHSMSTNTAQRCNFVTGRPCSRIPVAPCSAPRLPVPLPPLWSSSPFGMAPRPKDYSRVLA